MALTSHTLRYFVAALGIFVLFLACCTQADARSPYWRPSSAPPPYSFSVADENGDSLPTFVKEGRTFILGEPGLRYNVRIVNPTSERVEAVLSVDGRDAMSGEPGNYVRERGYVIPAHDSVLVEGFRTSLQQVAAFRFTSPEESYSARMGTAQNVGVIGVAFFPERVRPPQPVVRRPRPRPAPLPYDSYGYNRTRDGSSEAPAGGATPRRGSSSSASSAPSAQKFESERRADDAALGSGAAKGSGDADLDRRGSVNNLGTQFGEARESVVTSVAFERASPTHPALIVTLRYDDAEGLSARGIDLSPLRDDGRWQREPQAFPVSRFAPPPPR